MLLALLGCLATQGGPIWWASKHRAHHKFCDKPRDPHCPKLRGMIGAFAWFQNEHKYIDLEFSPLHLRGRLLMLIDTCARLGLGLAGHPPGLGLWACDRPGWCWPWLSAP